MKLQKKSLLVFVSLLITFLLVISIFFSTILLASYSALEEQYVAKDLNQAVNKLNDELYSMSALVSVWGPWDDTYNFVNGNYPGYIKSNLQATAFDTQHLNLIIITNAKGEILFSGAYDLQNKVMVPVPSFFSMPLDPKNPLMNMSDPHHITAGVLMLPGDPMLIVSQPIVHSDFSGQPRGVVIMGRYLNKEEISRLAEHSQPSLTLIRTDDPVLSPKIVSHIRETRGSKPGIIQQLNKEQVAGYALVRDIYGNDALILQITEARDIYQQGINTTVQVILIILGGGLLLGLLVIFLLDGVMLNRMRSLADQVNTIGRNGHTARHVEIGGDDELSGLGAEINRMLETIEQTQHKVIVSEARFRELTELLPLIIFEMDTTGNLTYVNKAGVELFGVTEHMITQGINIQQYLSPDNIELMHRRLSAVMSGVKSPGEIYTLKQLNGNLMRAMVFTSLIHREGGVTGFRGVVLDISERIRLEEALIESEEYLQTLIKSIHVGIFVIDAKTHIIIDANPVALKMMGTTKDVVINQLCHKVICPAEVGKCPITDLSKKVDNAERTLLTLDGREISIIKYIAHVTLHGKPCLLETFIDNSYRKKIELKLAESEEKYRALAENSADILFSIDVNGIFTYISPQVSRYGYSPEEIMGKAFQQFIYPDDQAHVLKNFRQEIHDRLSIPSTFRIVDNKGTIHWIEENSNIKRNEQGSPTGMVGILRDVTDRVRAEDALWQSRERLENIFRVSPVMVFETDPAGNLTFASDLWEQFIGYPFETMKGRHWTEIFPPDERDHLSQEMRTESPGQEKTSIETRFFRPDGSMIWVLSQSVTVYNLDGTIRGLVGTITDITERKNIEKTLAESEGKYRALTENTGDILFSMDMIGNFTYISPQVNKYGFLVEEVIGKSIRLFIHPEDIARVENDISQDLEKGAQFHSTFRILDKWENVHWFDEKGTLRLDQSGKPIGIYGVLRDDSERKRAEEALTELKNLYMAIFDNTGSAMIIIAKDTSIVMANPGWTVITGIPTDSAIGRSWTEVIHPQDLENLKKYHDDRIEQPLHVPREYSFRLIDMSKNIHYCLVSVVRIPGTTNSIAAVVDISERKRAEDAIELANKKLNLMNNITRHDILNTITGLLGCVDMANATSSSEERMSLLNDIKELTRTIQRQIAFTKEYQEVGVHLPLWQNVNGVINRIIPNFKNAGLHILVELENTEIYADPLLEKVFYNLVDNAIRYGDTITTITFYFLISDKGLSIISEDDGAGIPPEEKARIFERGVGRNTGMGLFLTREILGITGITIVENGVYGKGARFEILIPRGTFRFIR
jgi:PAS domain S-box-containing protein